VPESHPAKQFFDNLGSFWTERSSKLPNDEDNLDKPSSDFNLSSLGLFSPDEFVTQVFDPLDLVEVACSSISSIHTGLTHFIRQSLQPVDTCIVHMPVRQACLWPVPPPKVVLDWLVTTKPTKTPSSSFPSVAALASPASRVLPELD